MTPMMWLGIAFIALGGILWFIAVNESERGEKVGVYLFLIGLFIFVMEQWIIPFLKWGHQFM